VEGGATSKDLDTALDAEGFCTVTAPFSHVGIGGFTTGGGYGLLTYRYGLLMDSLLEAEVVLSNGEVKRCSEKLNEDLFWGLRGGGRWLGCVTRFKFKLYPKPSVVSAVMPFPVHAWEKVLRACDRRQSEAFNYTYAIVSHPSLVDVTVCLVHCIFFTGHDQAKKQYEDIIAEVGEEPMSGNCDKVLHELPWPRANRAIDHMVPWNTPMYTENFNLPDDNNLEHVVRFIDMALRKKPAHIIITLDHLDGPAYRNEQGRKKTMWTDRTSFFCGMFLCTLDPEDRSQNESSSRNFIKAVMDKTMEHRIPARTVNAAEYATISTVYGDEVAERFWRVKDRYDPVGFFSAV